MGEGIIRLNQNYLASKAEEAVQGGSEGRERKHQASSSITHL